MIAFLPALMKVLPPLVVPVMQVVEAAMGRGRGSEKIEKVVKSTVPILEQLEKDGIIPELPNADQLAAALEIIFQGNRARIEAARDTPPADLTPPGHKVIYVPDGARVVSIEFPTV